MLICENCYPDCLHCIYSIQNKIAKDGKYVDVHVVGCSFNSDAHHQSLAKGRHYCKDFKCIFLAQKEKENESC